MPDAHFLHYTAHGDFERGIFVPYATQVEAERQAAYDLMHGTDPEYIEGVFSAPYVVPKFGWLRSGIADTSEEVLLPHLAVANRTWGATRKQLLARASKHQDDMIREAEEAHAAFIRDVHEAVRRGNAFKGEQPGAAWAVMTGGTATAVPAAMAAATAKTLVLLTAGASDQPVIAEIGVSFDGVTASAVPVLVELVSGTAGAAGTSTAQTPKQLRGWPAQTPQTTCGQTYTAEPTTQLVNRKWYVTPNGGLWSVQFPLGREPTGIITAATDAKTWSVRATAPAIVNAHAYIEFEE